MNYYPHHIGDYTKDTAHLSVLEDGAYRRLLDLYYSTERPLPLDRAMLYRLTRAREKSEREAIDIVLTEFFQERSDGWHQERCDAEIAKMQEKSGKAKASAAIRWQSGRNPNASDSHTPSHSERISERISERMTPSTTDGDPKAMLPITNNQEPRAKSQEPLPKGKDKPAVADATRDDPIKDEIWKTGLAILKSQDVETQAARSFLGKLAKEYGQVLLLDAVRDCKRVGPAEAKAWLTARCQERRGKAGMSLEERNLAATAGWKPPEALQ